MTREKAIEVLENRLSQCQYVYDTSQFPDISYPGAKREIDALEIALSALRPVSREQVEKVWRGEWLNFYNDFSTAECSKCGELFDVSDTDENLKVLFDAFKKYYRFCPACGRAMTDEAVDMVVERMEALWCE